jgi:hypothetical protein
MTPFRIVARAFGLAMLVLSCLCGAVSAQTTTTYFADSFDSLNLASVNGQNGWTGNSRAPIQDTVTPSGNGKALALNFPDGLASHTWPASPTGGKASASFQVRTSSTGTAFSKWLGYLYDSSGRQITLFFHDSNNKWGIYTGGTYLFVNDTTPANSWSTISISCDFTAKTVSVYLLQGQVWTPLFVDKAFVNTSADNLAKIQWTRNGQGDPTDCYFDDVNIYSGPLASQAVSSYFVETFDPLTLGTIHNQNGWTSTTSPVATVQNTNTPSGTGQGLQLIQNASTSHTFPATPAGENVSVTFQVKTDSDGTLFSKWLFYLFDSAGNRVALFAHETSNKWIVQTGATSYQFAADETTPSTWQTIRIEANCTTKKLTFYYLKNEIWVPIFSNINFYTPTSNNLGKITITRPAQSPAPSPDVAYFDNISVRRTWEGLDYLTVGVQPSDTVKSRHSIFQIGDTIDVVLNASRQFDLSADTVDWELKDYAGTVVNSSSFNVSSGNTTASTTLQFTGLAAGYYALSAQFRKGGSLIKREGSRPNGLATFGVLPAITPLSVSNRDKYRFGIQGTTFLQSGTTLVGNPYNPMYEFLGVRWVNYARSWRQLEPVSAGQYTPKTLPSQWSSTYESSAGLATLTTVEGLPKWAIDWPTGLTPTTPDITASQAQSYPPANFSDYASFLQKVAQEQSTMRTTLFQSSPSQQKSYYQVHWEPDWHWKGTDADFIKMYEYAHSGLHAGDSQAVVMGPGYGVLGPGVTKLTSLLQQGLGSYLDGITTHAYYGGSGDPHNPDVPGQLMAPETGGVITNMRTLRGLVDTYIGPSAKLFQTEWGVPYRTEYAAASADLLRQQAAYTVRGHIIALGEGADTSFLFYIADYNGEIGYGLNFNLSMDTTSFGATKVSPKPSFMASAAMTRILEGTTNPSPIPDLPEGIYGYAFDRGPDTVVALWSNGATRSLNLGVGATSVTKVDFMGNSSTVSTPGETISLSLNDCPIYLLDVDRESLSVVSGTGS